MPPPVVESPAISGVEAKREETRKWIAYIALGGFFFLLGLIIIFGWLVKGGSIEDITQILTTTSGVLSGIVGAIVGFYFRETKDSAP